MHKPIPELTIDDSIRLWGLIIRKSVNDCWLWVDGSRDGKPRFNIKRVRYTATRVVYKEHFKVDPGELCVCHECDNPMCCNPFHFFLDTHEGNAQDRDDKNRGAAKVLTTLEKLAIIQMHESGHTQYEIASTINRPQQRVCRFLAKQKQ